jgi:hypothetical protein
MHGANPNVLFESDFGTRSAIMPGESVTHMACETSFPSYCEAVMENGGNPNLKKESVLGRGDTPLFSVIRGSAPNKKELIKLLVKKGTDLNHVNGSGMMPTRLAVGSGGQYDLALMLLEAGANFRQYRLNENSRLIHRVIEDESRLPICTPQQKGDYQRLLKWLVDHGESIDEARADMKRWASWSSTTGEFARKMAEEVAERKAREEREKKAAKKASDKKD